jgi:hypothetical protein
LEGHHFNLKLILELRDELLRVVRPVKVLSLRVLTRPGVVSSDNLDRSVQNVHTDGTGDLTKWVAPKFFRMIACQTASLGPAIRMARGNRAKWAIPSGYDGIKAW